MVAGRDSRRRSQVRGVPSTGDEAEGEELEDERARALSEGWSREDADSISFPLHVHRIH